CSCVDLSPVHSCPVHSSPSTARRGSSGATEPSYPQACVGVGPLRRGKPVSWPGHTVRAGHALFPLVSSASSACCPAHTSLRRLHGRTVTTIGVSSFRGACGKPCAQTVCPGSG